MTRYGFRFRRIGRSLSRVELMRSSVDPLDGLTDQELLDKNAGRRFLDFYGDEGLRQALEAYGFLDALRRRGWDDFTIETVAQDERHTLILSGVDAGGGEPERLLELVVRRDRLRLEPWSAELEEDWAILGRRGWEVLTVDWLTLRNPKRTFTEDRPRLPGQDAPGLGVGEQVLELLYRIVDRLRLDGLLTVAEHFHNAVLYARELPFADPSCGGRFHALEDLLLHREGLSFAQSAWAVAWGYVLDEADCAVRWRGEAMVHATDRQLRDYLQSQTYRDVLERTSNGLRYRLHRSAFDEHWAEKAEALLAPPASPDDS